jgi:hypothetical protein
MLPTFGQKFELLIEDVNLLLFLRARDFAFPVRDFAFPEIAIHALTGVATF